MHSTHAAPRAANISLASACLAGAALVSALSSWAQVPGTTMPGAEAAQAAPASATPAAGAPAPKPLMTVCGDAGLGGALAKANVNLYGYADSGYFDDFSSPKNGTGPTFVGTNAFKNEWVLDKADLIVERTVDPGRKAFDVGFHVEGLYGADAASIHSNGLGDDQSGRNQWDLIQAYVDLSAPGLPLRIRAGKWIELAGYEQFSANLYGAFSDPSKALYSYSYQFLYAEPGTQTGILATYIVNGRLSFDAGLTRGWNQSLRTSHSDPDFLGRVTYAPDDRTNVIFVMTEGPEFPAGVGAGLPKGDNSDWWTALDLVATRNVTDKLGLGLGIDCVSTPHIPGYRGSRRWGGLAGYVAYAIDSRATVNGRLEWYDDDSGGFSTGAPVGAVYYEATAGLAIKPAPGAPTWSNLLFRPEVRYDTATRSVFGGGDRSQLTFSADALFTF